MLHGAHVDSNPIPPMQPGSPASSTPSANGPVENPLEVPSGSSVPPLPPLPPFSNSATQNPNPAVTPVQVEDPISQSANSKSPRARHHL
jgi:hypothetical protein